MARTRNRTPRTTSTNNKGGKDGRTRSGKRFRHATGANIATKDPPGRKSRAAETMESCQDDEDDPKYRMLCLDLLERIEECGILDSFSSVQKASAVVLFASSALDTELLFDKTSAFLMPRRAGNVLAYEELFSHRERFEDILLRYGGRLDLIPEPEALQANQEESRDTLIEQPRAKTRRVHKRKKDTRGRKNVVLGMRASSSGFVQHIPLPPHIADDGDAWLAAGRSALIQAGWLGAGLGLTYLADQVLARRALY